MKLTQERFMDMLNIAYKKNYKYVMLCGARMNGKTKAIKKMEAIKNEIHKN